MNNLKKLILKMVLVINSMAWSGRLKILILIIFHWMKNHMKIFWFMTFRTKIGAKPLRIRFDKVDEFIKFYDGPDRYLALFDPENCDAIYNSIRYLISQDSGITYVFSHNYARTKIDSCDALSLEKTFILRNVMILIKSVFKGTL